MAKVVLTDSGIDYVKEFMEEGQKINLPMYGETHEDPLHLGRNVRLPIRNAGYNADDDDAFIWYLYNEEFTVVEE